MNDSRTRTAVPNYPAVCAAVWWSLFGAISLYWALGGNWLVDTAVQDQGQELARERPLWIVLLVLATAVAKFALALFGVLLARPNSLPIRRWMYGASGLLVGALLAAYGLLSSLPGLPYVFSGDMNTYRWMRMLVWMPQFWVGGILVVAATLVHLRRTGEKPVRATA